jgi:ABC-type nitrate/sulfonate/bicarbonate transport system substrate-binding protein
MKNYLGIRLLCLGVAFGPALVTAKKALGAEAQRLRIAYASRSNSATPQYVAQSKGFFKSEGLDIELIQMNPRLGATAVVNGDVAFVTAFVSTFRGILQGFPIKVVFVHLKKGPYFVMARPEIKDVQQLRGKKIGVSTIRGTDQLVAEEMLQARGFNPALLQAVGIGDAPLRLQALVSGAVDAVSVAPPHDLMLQKMGFRPLVGPPEMGFPASGMLTSDRLLAENPSLVKRALRALLRAHRFIFDNREETLKIMTQWLPQPMEIASHSYDLELKALTRDGQMTDDEIENLIARLGEKKRPLDQVRDFTPVRQALKELEEKK